MSLSSSETDGKNQKTPKKGKVDFICGGLQDQGQYTLFKNSWIISYLSYNDYYRPKCLVMGMIENVISFKRSLTLRLIFSCITRMGYQNTFGILQAGNCGVTQASKRLIIMAETPEERLPFYPEPIMYLTKKIQV